MTDHRLERTSPRRFNPYPAYKDSDVEWLGEIPAHWDVKPLKHLTAFATGWTPPTGQEDLYGGDHLWANISDLGPKVLYTTEKTISDTAIRETRMRIAAAGSLLFSFKLPVGTVSLAGADMYTNEAIAAFAPSERIDTGYLYWAAPVLVPRNAQENIYGAPLLSRERIANARLLRPPIPEQRTIAAFLDRETARIDALVAKKERLIELLQEKRTALITRAVTKGLDPNVPMKDFDVEWLGEIPAHWKVKRLKQLVPHITVGIVVTPSKFYVDQGVPCLRSLNIAQGHVEMAELVFISPAANELHRKSQIFEGDLVVVRTGRAGTAAVIPRDLNGTNCIDLLIIRRSEQLQSRFLYHFVNSRSTSAQVEAHSVGAIQEHYNTGTLANLCVPKVPPHEQEAISRFLDRETAKIDALVAKVREAIDRLKELRTALISAAVTGKIDLREHAT